VLRARDGCKTSFGALVRRYERGLFDFLRLRSRSIEDAEELVQESFLRAWEKLDLYDPRWSFGTWLYALARRLAAGRARRARVPEADQDAGELGATDAGPAEIAGRREEDARVWDVAARVLGEEQRSALWLRYADGLQPKEIAQVLGRRASSVRVLLFRARKELARALEDRAATGAGTASAVERTWSDPPTWSGEVSGGSR
jgi:RNA polymerase sigma-70 factor (ECF subfamily)